MEAKVTALIGSAKEELAKFQTIKANAAKILVELADVPYAEKLRDDFDKWVPHVTRACSVIEKIYSGTVNRGDEKGKGVLVRTVTMLDNMEKKWATLSVAAARFGVVLSDKGGKRRRGGAQRSS